MIKKKKNKIFDIAMGVIFCFFVVLFFSVRYYMKYWKVNFTTAIYQLLSPLEGTDSQHYVQYFYTAAVPAILFLVGWHFFWKFLGNKWRNFALFIEWHIRSREFSFRYGLAWFLKRQCGIFVSVVIIAYVVVSADAIGFGEFVNAYTHATTLFEDYYVAPEDVEIVFPKEKKNLVLIYLESMETTYMSTDVGGGKAINYIPELTELAVDNVSFSNTEKLGGAINGKLQEWTMGALLASSCGIPYKLPIGQNEAGNYQNFLPGAEGLGDILQQHGYANYFLCGSESAFGGRDTFYQQHGDYQIYDYSYAVESGKFDEEDKVFWGFEDRKLFEYAKEYLTEIAEKDQPFNFTMLTVDTHMPSGYRCELCGDKYEEQYANVISCSSKQVGEFIDWAKKQSWYEDTVVVIVGDHLSMKNNFWDDIGDYERCIYNCFLNTDKVCEDEVMKNRIFCSMDLFPTILSAMSIEITGNYLGLGVDLFSGEETLYEKLGIAETDELLQGNSKYYMEHFMK